MSPAIVEAAIDADVLRERPYGSARFAHIDCDGALTGIEMRAPAYRGFSLGGHKSVFRLPAAQGTPGRLVVAEAPIDALSLVVIEERPSDTEYLATAGGMGPWTLAVLETQFALLAQRKGSVVVATDADCAGETYAHRLCDMAQAAGVAYSRLIQPHGCKDWNEALKHWVRL